MEKAFEVLPAVENSFDQHGLGSDDKGDGGAPLEPGRAQTRQQIVALVSSQGKRRKGSAEGHDTGDISVGSALARMAPDVLVKGIDLAFGASREDNAHNVHYR
jgi:hypothetical protein